MTLRRLFQKGIRNPERIPLFLRTRPKRKLLNIYRNASIYHNSRSGIGTNVFDLEWDILIVLDTCRVDSLRHVATEYEFLSDIHSLRSVGGQSAEWIARTFDREYEDVIGDTALITSNPHANTVLDNRLRKDWKSETQRDIKRLNRYGKWDFVDPSALGKYEALWEYGGEEYRYPPRYITDRGISLNRDSDYERMILHYMPPHTPYRDEFIPDEYEIDSFPNGPFTYFQQTGKREVVYETYLNMLRWVLDEVELLLNNVDASKVAITADHGEAFGEYGVYFHRAGSLHPWIRNVPWTVTSGTDSGSYVPSFSPDSLKGEKSHSVEESLRSLGYL